MTASGTPRRATLSAGGRAHRSPGQFDREDCPTVRGWRRIPSPPAAACARPFGAHADTGPCCAATPAAAIRPNDLRAFREELERQAAGADAAIHLAADRPDGRFETDPQASHAIQSRSNTRLRVCYIGTSPRGIGTPAMNEHDFNISRGSGYCSWPQAAHLSFLNIIRRGAVRRRRRRCLRRAVSSSSRGTGIVKGARTQRPRRRPTRGARRR